MTRTLVLLAVFMLTVHVTTACHDRASPEAGPGASTAPPPEATSSPALDAPPPVAPPSAPVTSPIVAPPDVAAPPVTAARTASGVATVVLRKGTGTKRPGPTDLITVHYTGWTTTGDMFDSSVQRGAPETLPLMSAPRAWREAVAEMTIGERRRLWLPEQVAAQGTPGLRRGMLVYDVELISVAAAPAPPPDLATVPDDATTTASGLAYKRLVAGSGKVRPTEASMLVVHYTGWTTRGEMIESSVVRGRPAERTLAAMMPGWGEALRLMVAGDKMRLWIPAELAYRGEPDHPRGRVVFELELLAIK